MSSVTTSGAQRVVVVTGGGAGIGAAIAEELGRNGDLVITVDPLVTLDGTERLAGAEETTADRIVATGGSARASSVSVTDAAGVSDLFDGLVDEFGRLDVVVNVAGITRPTTFASGSEEDWLGVLSVHLDGYLNILRAALPIMATAGRGHILGVTSGSGWRAADTGAYGCAKRAVAALTWQLGQLAPPGVVVNAVSPIAVTRMVTAALERTRAASDAPRASASGGLSLGSMPDPEELGPLGAHLVSDAFSWCRGQVIFAGGSEIAVVEPPRLIEVVRVDHVPSLAPLLDAVVTKAFGVAEARQGSAGGGNPRFGPIFDQPVEAEPFTSTGGSCAVVSDRPELVAAVTRALGARGVRSHIVDIDDPAPTFAQVATALRGAAESVGLLDAVVVALSPGAPSSVASVDWERALDEHAGIVGCIRTDAAWARAVADHAAEQDRPMRLVTLVDAADRGGRSRAQAAAQHSRAAHKGTKELVAAFAVSLEESPEPTPIGELVAHLLCSPEAASLSGAELVAGPGWFGLRHHPRPAGAVTFGGPALPEWLDDTLRQMVGAPATGSPSDGPTR